MKHDLGDLRRSSRFDSNPVESDGRYLEWHEASQPATDSFDKRTDRRFLHNDRSFFGLEQETAGRSEHGRKIGSCCERRFTLPHLWH